MEITFPQFTGYGRNFQSEYKGLKYVGQKTAQMREGHGGRDRGKHKGCFWQDTGAQRSHGNPPTQSCGREGRRAVCVSMGSTWCSDEFCAVCAPESCSPQQHTVKHGLKGTQRDAHMSCKSSAPAAPPGHSKARACKPVMYHPFIIT